jgi:hypothetical protein
LSTLIALLALTTVAAQPPWLRRVPPPIPRQERERDSREVWRYFANGGGAFQRVRGRQWAEYRNTGDPIYYREVARTPEFVELFDQGRSLGVRLYPDKAYQNNGYEGWTPVYDGRWE